MSKRYSLIIGIDDYQNPISSLNCAVADAKDLKEALTFAGQFRIPTENQILLCNKDATRENIITELKRIQKLSAGSDFVLFYYAGHGYSETNNEVGDEDDHLRKYIVPYKTDINNIDVTAIDFNFLSQRLDAIITKQLLMIFDCCYSGAAGGRCVQLPGNRVGPKSVGARYLEKVSGEGRIVMTACLGTEVAREDYDAGHGIFTNYIIEGLKGKADYKKDGVIDLEELWMYVQDNTIEHTTQQQHPVRVGWTEGSSIYLSEHQDLPTKERKEYLRTIIIEKFGDCKLQDVRIADSDDISAIGKEASKYLEEKLRSSSQIAVSCGSTLIETINQMKRRSNISYVDIYPLNGSPSDEVRLTDSMVLTYLLWSKFETGKATAHIVPTGIPSELFERVEEGIDAIAKKVLQEAKNSDIFLFGIGSPTEKNKNIPYLLKKAMLTSVDLNEMGAIGEINFHLYDKDGKLLALKDNIDEQSKKKITDYNSKFFSLSARDLFDITKRPGIDLIVVAGGSGKREAIASGIRGGFARTLITDISTASWLANIALCKL